MHKDEAIELLREKFPEGAVRWLDANTLTYEGVTVTVSEGAAGVEFTVASKSTDIEDAITALQRGY